MVEKNVIDEKELLLRLQQGDRMAFEKIYHIYAPRLAVKLSQLVKSEEISQDLLQDIFMKIWQMRREVDVERSFGALLYTMAANLSNNAFRTAVREQNRRMYAYPQQSYTHIEENIQYEETNKLLEEALSTLSDRQREVYILHKLEGKSYKEIADLLQISHSAINQHLQLANKYIRAFMQSRLPHLLMLLAPVLVDNY
ncbi:RNA polymerase sigma factor [Sphingobacterium haloxyli]|uniref:RNA polymerase sigma-70 factor n=1 Tax=Sphingobacterium haloxyli TaxID=2100533 RepID=A0A2S9J4R3_9SPHI|nr:sigma-70 family RNA polymerase sigma factor [Sphingobacterium haloxyli]PRD47742.1 RNA polymerase sigma-70 factor [Sphingobacterium haloxyli]